MALLYFTLVTLPATMKREDGPSPYTYFRLKADGCFNLILQILRGPDIPNSDRLVADPNLESNDDDTVWIDHKTGVFINQLQGFVFVAVKVSDVTKPAESAGSIVLTAHLVDDEQEEWFVLQTP